MKAHTTKKEHKLNKTGWLPFLVISGGLIAFIIILKIIFAFLSHSS